jgi:hypothetical protein
VSDQRTTGTFDFGRVVQRTFGAIGRNFVPFILLALLLTGVPAYITAFAQFQVTTEGGDGFEAVWIFLITTLVGVCTACVLQAALVDGAVADLNGGRASFGRGLKVGMRMLLPVLSIALLLVLGVALGLLLLIVPGVILMTMWAVAVPAEVVERTGTLESFGRSRALTRGHRWSVFFLLVLSILASTLIGALAGATIGAIGGFTDTQAFLLPASAAVGQAFGSVISSVGAASLYVELRQTKDGVGPEALAEVFA